MKIDNLTVTVKYRVGLGKLKVPKKVYDQLIAAEKRGDTLEPDNMKYPDATEWLSDNIREKDCMDWECEIYDLS